MARFAIFNMEVKPFADYITGLIIPLTRGTLPLRLSLYDTLQSVAFKNKHIAPSFRAAHFSELRVRSF